MSSAERAEHRRANRAEFGCRRGRVGTGIIMKSGMNEQSRRLPKLCFVADALPAIFPLSFAGRAQLDRQPGRHVQQKKAADDRMRRAAAAHSRHPSQSSRSGNTFSDAAFGSRGQRINLTMHAVVSSNLNTTPGILSLEPSARPPLNWRHMAGRASSEPMLSCVRWGDSHEYSEPGR